MRLRLIALLGIGSCILLGASCPTSDPFPRPVVGAPSIAALEMTAIKISDAYRAAVHLYWNLPQGDAQAIREVVILRKKQGIDSAYDVFHYGIPDSVHDDYDVLNPKDFPTQGNFTLVWYRMYAIDTLGRPGDTSAPDSLQLCWPPLPQSPLDTLRKNRFAWQTVRYLAGYFTYMFLWNDARGLIWASPKPSEPSYGHETADSFFVRLPDSLYPLTPGAYWYGAKVEIPGGNIQSLSVQQFYAP